MLLLFHFPRKSDVNSELADLTKMFSRQTDKDLKNRDIYLSANQSVAPKKERKRKKSSEVRMVLLNDANSKMSNIT
jgi:uncharacterized protein (DUF2225 family)